MKLHRVMVAGLASLLALSCHDATTGIDPNFSQGGNPGGPGGGGGGGGVASVEVTPAMSELVGGGTVQLTAVAKNRKGKIMTDVSFTWSSSNAGVATVSQSGVVTGVAVGGPVTITASTGGKRPVVGTATVSVVPQPQWALDFNDAWATVSDHSDLDLSATWTLEAWIKPRNVGSSDFQHVISKWNGGGNSSFTLEIHAGYLRSGIHDGVNPTQAVESYGSLVNDQWQHVAITLENGTLSLYINGVLDRTYAGSQTPMNSDRPLSFGREGPPYGGWRYDGLIDEVRVWNVARTAAQLLGAMNVRLVGTEAGLVGYWRFDEGTGDVAFDATGRGHNAQLGNLVGPDANDPVWSTDRAPIP